MMLRLEYSSVASFMVMIISFTRITYGEVMLEGKQGLADYDLIATVQHYDETVERYGGHEALLVDSTGVKKIAPYSMRGPHTSTFCSRPQGENCCF
ncbi:MAG: hypothetical protein HYS08_01800 [Chlamydiae bacterium]|nr:hypothetical protein [Chlamydiota bacterium]